MLLGAQERSDAWLHYGRNYAAWRYAPIELVDRSNVHRLELLWKLDVLEGTKLRKGGFEATALFYDGRLFVTTTDSQLLSIDARTGEILWRYLGEPDDPRLPSWTGPVNRGAAIVGRRVCMGTGHARLRCFDVDTGLLLWDRMVDDYRAGAQITSAPLVVDDKIVIGVSGAEMGVRGFIDAYRVETGERAWRFWVVPAPGEPGSETWEGDSWRHGGGTAWVTGTYDPELHRLYWGTGNPAPDYHGGPREGDNLFTNSIVALDPDSGERIWHFQTTPHDLFDWSGVAEPILVDETLDGERVPALVQVNRNGYAYLLDRRDGRLLRATPYTRTNWAFLDENGKPVIRPELARRRSKRVCPGGVGGKNWPPAAFSPRTRLVYIPHIVRCQTVLPGPYEPVYRRGLPYTGGVASYDEAPAEGFVTAMDVATGEIRWEVDNHGPNWAGLLATGGGLVFGGSFDGNLRAFHDETGEVLWEFQTGTGVYAPPTTFVMDGRQYLGLASGFGSMGNGTSGHPPHELHSDYYLFGLADEPGE